MIDRHHAAMLAADIERGHARSREDAHRLAAKLNGGTCGIIAGPDAPGCILEAETAAAPGTVPLWGQAGEFIVTVDAMRVRIEIKGMFGIGSTFCLFPGFYARAVDMDRPFLSETGFRSFLGLSGDLVPGFDARRHFVRAAIAAHVRRELKGPPEGDRAALQKIALAVLKPRGGLPAVQGNFPARIARRPMQGRLWRFPAGFFPCRFPLPRSFHRAFVPHASLRVPNLSGTRPWPQELLRFPLKASPQQVLATGPDASRSRKGTAGMGSARN